jgi:RNA polymerase sigma factor (TIGR02999 family)
MTSCGGLDRARSRRFDVILLDVMLPGLDPNLACFDRAQMADAIDSQSPRRAMTDFSARDPGHFATIAEQADAGDGDARDALFAALYDQLHHLAEGHIRRSGGQITMGATTLLHEAYLNLAAGGAAFPGRLRFLKYASRAMRGLIIDYVRSRRAQKRGGEITFTRLDDVTMTTSADSTSLERLGQALDELATIDAALAELVDLKFFCGFSFVEIAELRGVSERTVQRDWAKARLLLHDALGDAGSASVD